MKLVFRIIGIVVVVVVLLAALLYFLNEKGVLKGPISEWITNVKNGILGISDDTKNMIDQMSNSDHPVEDSININGGSKEKTASPAPDAP